MIVAPIAAVMFAGLVPPRDGPKVTKDARGSIPGTYDANRGIEPSMNNPPQTSITVASIERALHTL